MMDAEPWKVFLAVAAFIAVVLLELIRSRLGQVNTELKRLTEAVSQLRGSIPSVGTAVRPPEEAIKVAREKEESEMGTELLDDD
jgi:hypothetical protein